MNAVLKHRMGAAALTAQTKLALALVALVLVGVPVLVIWTSQHSTQTNQHKTLEAFATATQNGDYATAKSMLALGSFAQLYWQDRTSMFAQQGRMGMVHILHPTQTGKSLTAVLSWHTQAMNGTPMANGKMSTDPLCMTVQVGPDGKITPLTDYHACTGGSEDGVLPE